MTKSPKSFRWPLIAAGILFTHFSLMILAVVTFVRHNDAVIPNYYEKAVRWDEFKAAQQRGTAIAGNTEKDGRR